MNAANETKSFNDFRVADLGLADWGRKEIAIAETEMPGLMAIRDELAPEQPLRGARIAGSLHMTIQTAVLIETLQALGALVRWASCNIYSTQDHAAAAIAAAGTPVFAYKGETLDEYWNTRTGSSQVGRESGPEHDPGRRRRRHAARAPGRAPRPIRHVLRTPRATRSVRCSRRSRRGSRGFEVLFAQEGRDPWRHRGNDDGRQAPLPDAPGEAAWASRRSTSTTRSPKSKFDNLYGCRESLVDGIKRATDVMIAGKVALVNSYGDVGKGFGASAARAVCQVWVAEIDPICALQAAMEGYRVVTMDWAADKADIFVTATGNIDVITHEHEADEEQRDRVQHRPLRQRDRRGGAPESTSGRTSSRRSTT